jgi:hypothetical protein
MGEKVDGEAKLSTGVAPPARGKRGGGRNGRRLRSVRLGVVGTSDPRFKLKMGCGSALTRDVRGWDGQRVH